jgi:Lrp/AsnC family leucine-responsive transcriptional regulator
MIDEIDVEILRLLQYDGHMTSAAIGENVGLTNSTVHERIKKLEKRGVIRGYTALIDAAAVGQPITAFVRLTTGTLTGATFRAAKESFTAFVKQHPNILECHSVAGDDCYFLKVRVTSPQALESLLEELRTNAYIDRSVCTVVLSTLKETLAIEPALP